MKSKSYKIDFEIYLVFIIVISISVFNSIYSSLNISHNQDATSKILSVEIPSFQKLENMNFLIIRAKMYSTNWVYLPDNNEEKERLQVLQGIEYPALRSEISALMKDWNDKPLADSMQHVFQGFENLMSVQKKIMNLLHSRFDYSDLLKQKQAEFIIDQQILPESSRLITALDRIISKKKANSEIVRSTISSTSRTMMWSVMFIGLLTVFVVLLAAFYISNHIIVPTMKLKNFIFQMGKGEIPEINIRPSKNAIGQMTEAVKALNVSLRKTATIAHRIGDGDLTVEFQPLSDNDELGNALVQMQRNLCNADEGNRNREWISATTEKINERLRENTDDIDRLSDSVIHSIARSLHASQGAIYLLDEDSGGKHIQIRLQGAYSLDKQTRARKIINSPDSLISQCLRDKEFIYLKDLASYDLKIHSAFTTLSPTHLLVVPLFFHGRVFGAIELSGFYQFNNREIDFIKNIGETIGSTITSVKSNTLTKKLLSETRKQAARLSSQEEELRNKNEELSHQSSLLKVSEEGLKQSNLDLKIKARELQQKNEINEQAKQALILKAKELEQTSKYKSEFLANMSHELRTPLNSVLILAKLLEENKEQTLNNKQREYAGIIHKSGKDLLLLINDILDLSKIEAGKMELIPEDANIVELSNEVKMLFNEIAIDKKIEFSIDVDNTLPSSFVSDKAKLGQILKNLLSNAFKFTSADGIVSLKISHPEKDVLFASPSLFNRNNIIEFSVTDSGIGIPLDKQSMIFEAFQQANGATNRNFVGTGLGLSISKMLVAMLGGEMQLKSEPGKGSTFSVYLPVNYLKEKSSESTETYSGNYQKQIRSANDIYPFNDDRDHLTEEDKILLVVENDLNFTRVLTDMAHERQFKVVVANDGYQGLEYAKQYNPSAIIMDMQLQGMNGWSLLNKIKENENLTHIPVHIMSAMDKQQLAIDMGASTFLRKPLDKQDLDHAFVTIDTTIEADIRHVLLIEDVQIHQEIVRNLLASHHRNVEVSSATTSASALELLSAKSFDCIVLDLDLGNGAEEGEQLLTKLKGDSKYKLTPVIVFTGTDLDQETEIRIKALAAKIVSKNSGSFDKLLEQTEIFLHKVSGEDFIAPSIPTYMLDILKNKTVLVVDDDMRNIYALSRMLEAQQMIVVTASNGIEALEKLSTHPSPDIILMDIMMPEMDGYETMQRIRKSEHLKTLPIIAVTAKAMIGDRERCIQCGASDYISKPVNPDQLFSLMRVWLYHE